MSSSHSQLVKEHFDLDYKNYDEVVPILAPGYMELKRSIVEAINGYNLKDTSVLDLGCGTAVLGAEILSKTSNNYIGIDFSESMIREARRRLESFGERATLIQDDFFNIPGMDLPVIDCVVSMLAIHHFENKQAVYQMIYNLFESRSGLFVLSDLVVDPQKNKDVYGIRRTHMKEHGMSEEEIDDWFSVFNSEDQPSTIDENLDMLKSVGFNSSVVWQNHSYATFVCSKFS